MIEDTTTALEIQRVEQGLRTLTHDWRNVLNGINLRVSSAQISETGEERQSHLAAAQQLIVAATGELSKLSRRIESPHVELVAYPIEYFLEDIAVVLSREIGENASRLKWQNSATTGKVMVDFSMISQVLSELIENTLRYLPLEDSLVLSTNIEKSFFMIKWSEKSTFSLYTKNWGRVPFLTTERGHLGLGLYFAKRALQAHGGLLSFNFSETNHTLLTILRIPMEVL